MEYDEFDGSYDRREHVNFYEAKHAVVEWHLRAGEGASDEKRQKFARPSQLRSLLTAVVDSAAEWASARGLGPNDLESVARDGVDIVWGVVGSVTRWDAPDESKLDFWRHGGIDAAEFMKNGKPCMSRDEIISEASTYLTLPYRVPALERLLVDLLIALELYAYADEMLREPRFAFLPVMSPLKQRNVVLRYFGTLALAVIVFGGIAVAAISFLPEKVSVWVAGIAAALLAFDIVVSTVRLPFVWRHQKSARKKVHELLLLMENTYRELDANGAVSSRRVREVAVRAADAGAVWPGPLFAILDDNIVRGGRL